MFLSLILPNLQLPLFLFNCSFTIKTMFYTTCRFLSLSLPNQSFILLILHITIHQLAPVILSHLILLLVTVLHNITTTATKPYAPTFLSAHPAPILTDLSHLAQQTEDYLGSSRLISHSLNYSLASLLIKADNF